jgi:hypothetical protein
MNLMLAEDNPDAERSAFLVGLVPLPVCAVFENRNVTRVG